MAPWHCLSESDGQNSSRPTVARPGLGWPSLAMPGPGPSLFAAGGKAGTQGRSRRWCAAAHRACSGHPPARGSCPRSACGGPPAHSSGPWPGWTGSRPCQTGAGRSGGCFQTRRRWGPLPGLRFRLGDMSPALVCAKAATKGDVSSRYRTPACSCSQWYEA